MKTLTNSDVSDQFLYHMFFKQYFCNFVTSSVNVQSSIFMKFFNLHTVLFYMGLNNS